MDARPKWFLHRRPQENAVLRLFCLPPAGAGASVYRGWLNAFPSAIEVCPIQLPGRENRFAEPFAAGLDELVAALCDVISELSERPFVLFGHSMGGYVAYRVAQRLERERRRLPEKIIIGGCRPPHFARRESPIHEMSETELVDRLRLLGGQLPSLDEEPELLEAVLPCIRADFHLLETDPREDLGPIGVSIDVIAGSADPVAPPCDMAEWVRYTTRSFSSCQVEGGHFFATMRPEMLLGLLRRDFQVLVSRLNRTATLVTPAARATC
jgi:medium-chain acyl-[acyl-carrier-protein] hydrolase